MLKIRFNLLDEETIDLLYEYTKKKINSGLIDIFHKKKKLKDNIGSIIILQTNIESVLLFLNHVENLYEDEKLKEKAKNLVNKIRRHIFEIENSKEIINFFTEYKESSEDLTEEEKKYIEFKLNKYNKKKEI